jgi:PAS domain S-box-containing protein
MFGYLAEEVIGKPVMILIPPERHDEEPVILERIRRGERVEWLGCFQGLHVDPTRALLGS